MVFHTKIEKTIDKYRSANNSKEYEYAHNLVMKTGEILSRPVNERYPDMEDILNSIKVYYERSNNVPVKLHDEGVEKVKHKLVSVK